jgi:hypothetical protein
MGRIKIADNSIWLKHIEDDRPLRERLSSLNAGETVKLEVAGVVGTWERMKNSPNGQPTAGIKPVDSMKRAWTEMQKDRGKVVNIRQVVEGDTYLASLALTLSEWDSPGDEEAFRDL